MYCGAKNKKQKNNAVMLYEPLSVAIDNMPQMSTEHNFY